jgi:aldose 1-epimerase
MSSLKTIAVSLLAATSALAQSYNGSNSTLGPDADGKYTISAEGIRALFIPYGASVTNLFVNDKNGVERDIVLGWDNATYYEEDPLHPHFGGVPGMNHYPAANAPVDLSK